MTDTPIDRDDRPTASADVDRSTDAVREVDDTGDPISNAEQHEPEATGPRVGPGGREVVVPLRLYKTITVFSTLIAVVAFVFGFIMIDAATLQVSLLRTAIASLLAVVGLAPDPDVFTAALALVGLGLIAFGSVVYVVGTRFRAQGMGKPQEDSTEQ